MGIASTIFANGFRANLAIGANRGVGLALVKALVDQKYRVWGSVRPQTIGDASVEEVGVHLPHLSSELRCRSFSLT